MTSYNPPKYRIRHDGLKIPVEERRGIQPHPPKDETCPIHGIAECMCDDPADWAEWTSTES